MFHEWKIGKPPFEKHIERVEREKEKKFIFILVINGIRIIQLIECAICSLCYAFLMEAFGSIGQTVDSKDHLACVQRKDSQHSVRCRGWFLHFNRVLVDRPGGPSNHSAQRFMGLPSGKCFRPFFLRSRVVCARLPNLNLLHPALVLSAHIKLEVVIHE